MNGTPAARVNSHLAPAAMQQLLTGRTRLVPRRDAENAEVKA